VGFYKKKNVPLKKITAMTFTPLFLNQPSDWIIILVIVLLFFGGKKLPELARGLGKGVREFKDAAAGVKNEVEKEINEVKDSANKQ
jgi:sec-independent protein translocase protein TatA